jgi:signal transduction histidine kinase
MIMWGPLAFGCALPTSVVLLRRWPLPALAVVLGGLVANMALQPRPSYELVVLACIVGLEVCYIAATHGWRISAAGAALGAAGLLIPILAVPSLGPLRGGSLGGSAISLAAIAIPLFTAIAWLIGHSIRQAQARAELVRAQAAAQATMAERLRIARELHDLVAHSTGIIAIQAGSGRRVFDARPDEARDALAAIEAISRDTLSGLRRMVTGLRRADLEPGAAEASLGATPGLADIDKLAATARDAGVQVEVDWHGGREALPSDIDLSAFRIIQEAITNVVRHAHTGRCQVSIDHTEGQLSIEVTDSGRGGSMAGTGYGITGMRERAVLLGGDFSAGPRADGGFRVTARLPVPASATAP